MIFNLMLIGLIIFAIYLLSRGDLKVFTLRVTHSLFLVSVIVMCVFLLITKECTVDWTIKDIEIEAHSFKDVF